MDNQQVDANRKLINDQLEAVSLYVGQFEVLTQKDEAALTDLLGLVNSLTQRIREMDAAQKRRIELMNELAKAYGELEESQKRFADKVKVRSE